MADYSGNIAKAAFRKDRGLYGGGPDISYPQTPVDGDLGAGHLAPFTHVALTRQTERLYDETLNGSGGVAPAPIVRDNAAGGFGGNFLYRGLERMLCCAMGYEHPAESPAVLNGVTATEYQHLFEVDQNLRDEAWGSDEIGSYVPNSADRKVRRGQLGVFKGLDDWVYSSCFVNVVTITGTPGDGVTVEMELMSYRLHRGDYSSDTWAEPAGTRIMAIFQDAEIKFGLRSTGEAGLWPARCNKFEIKIDNKLSAEDQSDETGVYICQPMRSTKPEITVMFDAPRYTDRDTGDDTRLTIADLEVDMSAKVVLSGPIIDTAALHSWGFFFPALRLLPERPSYPIDGPGPIRGRWGFKAYSPDGTDIFETANYEGITLMKNSPLVVTCRNGDDTNYLLET